MLNRSLVLLAALATALTLAGSALAVQVHIRVEGQTRTIFGAGQPMIAATANPLDALDSASLAGEFYYHVRSTSFGDYVDQIGRYPESLTNGTGWVFKVNGSSPPVGARDVVLKDGDSVLWYFAAFGPTGGPQTLALSKGAKKNCYRLAAQDDQGKSSNPAGAVLNVDGRTVAVKSGAACVGKHVGLVRGTLTGAVRSNVLR